MSVDDLAIIEACGLIHLLHMSPYQKSTALLTVLAERWNNEHNTFHLLMSEITRTSEDVYQILWIPIIGEVVEYDAEDPSRTDALREVFVDPHITGYSAVW